MRPEAKEIGSCELLHLQLMIVVAEDGSGPERAVGEYIKHKSNEEVRPLPLWNRVDASNSLATQLQVRPSGNPISLSILSSFTMPNHP